MSFILRFDFEGGDVTHETGAWRSSSETLKYCLLESISKTVQLSNDSWMKIAHILILETLQTN